MLNPFIHNRLFYFKVLDTSISIKKGCLMNFIFTIFRKITKLYENNIDPDRIPLSVVSDLDLQCFPTSLLRDLLLLKHLCTATQSHSSVLVDSAGPNCGICK